MAVTIKELVPAKYAEDSQTTQYTATNASAIIDKATVTNITGSNAVLSVNLVSSGDAVGDDNLIVDARQIAPGETYTLPELVGQALESGSVISTLAGTASALTIRVTGREITS